MEEVKRQKERGRERQRDEELVGECHPYCLELSLLMNVGFFHRGTRMQDRTNEPTNQEPAFLATGETLGFFLLLACLLFFL